MPREKRSMSEMFYEFVQIGNKIGDLKRIVQNEEMTISDDDLQEWSDLVNAHINQLNSLKEDVIRFYQD